MSDTPPDCIIVGGGPAGLTAAIYLARFHLRLKLIDAGDSRAARCAPIDGHQRTSIPGLYAARDVVIGLDQISHAMGEGGVAATTIRNDLAKERPLLR